jgi:flagellar basal body-associated protein FliL
MKRCPKCSRTFPDENQKFCTVDGGLLMPDPPAAAFDPNLTVRDTSKELPPLTGAMDASEAPTSVQLPNMDAEAASFGISTFREKPTTPTGTPTSADLTAPPMQAPTADISSAVQPAPQPLAQPAAPPKKKSALPWILVGLVVLLLLGGGGATALFFLVIKPRLEARNQRPVITNRPTPANENPNTNPPNTSSTPNTNTNGETKKEPDVFVPPAHSVQFVNSKENLDGKLAEHYLDFSFYYLDSWTRDPKAGVPGAISFVKVERRLPPDLTQENVAVGWYDSKGTFALDKDDFPKLVQSLSSNYATRFPDYQKLSEGPTKVNSLDAYEFKFEGLSKGTAQGDIKLWGRVIFLPSGVEGNKSGVTLLIFTTSLAPELQGPDDVGVKGELPVILDSFRFGSNK